MIITYSCINVQMHMNLITLTDIPFCFLSRILLQSPSFNDRDIKVFASSIGYQVPNEGLETQHEEHLGNLL